MFLHGLKKVDRTRDVVFVVGERISTTLWHNDRGTKVLHGLNDLRIKETNHDRIWRVFRKDRFEILFVSDISSFEHDAFWNGLFVSLILFARERVAKCTGWQVIENDDLEIGELCEFPDDMRANVSCATTDEDLWEWILARLRMCTPSCEMGWSCNQDVTISRVLPSLTIKDNLF